MHIAKPKFVAFISAFSLFVCLSISAQSSQKHSVTKPSTIHPFPKIIDFPALMNAENNNNFESTGDERDKRQAKSINYNRPGSAPIKEDPGTTPIPLSSHWGQHLPALPVGQSNIVVLGSATGSKSFFSADKHAVYSEFTFRVEGVLKGAQTVNLGDVPTTTRNGGIVRFSTGTTYVYEVARQGWPVAGHRYVLFLSKNGSGDFDIVTGYELKDSIVEPLDGIGSPSALAFQKYAGASESTLLDAIKTSISISVMEGHNL